ncbi:phosphoglycerate kinase [Candidatus Woesearchaeota archaeon]|nr:phosphoglycerate kinase [Candidatus Woesearchaeota archaeon]
MQLKSLKEADVKGKTVLVRVDFNVAVDEHGNITEDQRIRDALPTIKHLLRRQAKEEKLQSSTGLTGLQRG